MMLDSYYLLRGVHILIYCRGPSLVVVMMIIMRGMLVHIIKLLVGIFGIVTPKLRPCVLKPNLIKRDFVSERM